MKASYLGWNHHCLENLQRFYIPDRKAARSPTDTDIVTLEFPENASTDVIVDIPIGSGWYSPQTCHCTQAMCRRIETLNGIWLIGNSRWSIPGEGPSEHPRLFRSIGAIYGPTKEVTRARLFGSQPARQLDHVLASAIQDAEIYFSLCSTPLWLRLLYFSTKKLSPKAADVLARRVLWIQIRCIFFHNDTWEYRGTCRIFQYIFPFFSAPPWVAKFEDWSKHFMSEQFLRTNYWVGYALFGMRPWYAEYELLPMKEW